MSSDFDFDGTVEWVRDEGFAYDLAGGVGTIVMTGVTPSQKFEYSVIGDTSQRLTRSQTR